MIIRQYTTPTLQVEVGADLTGCKAIISIQYGSDRKDYEFSGDDISVEEGVTTLAVKLSQEDTANYKALQFITLQANWISPDGVRCASEQKRLECAPNLLQEVISYGN